MGSPRKGCWEEDVTTQEWWKQWKQVGGRKKGREEKGKRRSKVVMYVM